MAIALLVIGFLVLIGGSVYLIHIAKAFAHSARPSLTKKEQETYLLLSLGISLGALLVQAGVFLYNPTWKDNSSYSYPLFVTMALVGAFGWAFSCLVLWLSFYFYYYKPKMDPAQRLFFRKATFAAIPFVLAFFLISAEGLAPYLTYPLISGFAINDSGFRWTRGTWTGGGFHVAFYALTMLFGVAVCYWVCDHRFYKEFHKHGILDNLTILAFICGVVGARIWYVAGNWTRDGFDQDFSSVFAIWNGGLTIMGGALGGIIGGVAFMMIRRKYVNVRWAMDVIIPTILLAQCVGRWGNFFNNEVYGQVVNIADGWNWLPLFIQKQMGFGLSEGQIHVPLFLIEGLINLAGYFLIAWGVGKGLKKITARGDLAGCYFIWYGTIRMILEPLRDGAYNMGADNEWSIWSSLVYVIIGVGLILFDHLLDLKEKKVAGDVPFFAASAALALAALLTPFLTGVKGVGYTSSGGVITNSETERYMGMNLIFGGNGFAASAGLIIGYLFILAGLVYAALTFIRLRKSGNGKGAMHYAISSGLLLVGVILFALAKTFLGLKDGTGDFGALTSVTISYNLGPGFLLTICLSLIACALLLIPTISKKELGNLIEEEAAVQ